MKVFGGTTRWLLLLFVCGVLAVLFSYETIPDHNTDQTHFDTLIVLGSPADPDGKPSTEQRERVMAAVRELQAGHSEHIIVSGAAVHNQWVEADKMAAVAEAAGVPADEVIVERNARNTLQNIYYSHLIMQQHGWKSAEVLSSPSHIPRASLILEHYDFAWRAKPGHWPPEYVWARIAPHYIYEALGTTVLRWFGFRPTPFLPEKH